MNFFNMNIFNMTKRRLQKRVTSNVHHYHNYKVSVHQGPHIYASNPSFKVCEASRQTYTRERPTIQPVFPQSCSQRSRNKWTQGSRGREGTCQPVDPTLKNVAPRRCECPFLPTVSCLLNWLK